MNLTISINTKYNQPTETKGSSITAYLTSGYTNKQITIDYDYALSASDNHLAAAKRLAKQFNARDVLYIKETQSQRGNKYIGKCDQ
jgi:hypothetical protein